MPSWTLELTGSGLTTSDVARVARRDQPVNISATALPRLAAGREVVERHLARGLPVYGLTTGLGGHVTMELSAESVDEFSRLTVLGRVHGVGPPLPVEIVRALMLSRLNGMLSGGSGVRPVVAERVAELLNARIHPVVPSIGSVGAGDLCLLAHLGYTLLGEGEVFDAGGTRRPAREALAAAGIEPLELAPKEGLAICSASSVSAGQSALAVHDGEELLEMAHMAAALTMEGFRANVSALDARVSAARPAPGQPESAGTLLSLLEGGDLTVPQRAARRLQDPLSLRCTAPVHGALHAAVDFARPAVDAELNGAGDNPLVLIEDEEILSTGNFHTPMLALAMETLGQAVAGLAAVSVSRAAKLLSHGLSDLPATLSPRGAPRAGFAPLLKTADALVSEIRHRSMPAPREQRGIIDGVEDDVTNALLSARKASRMIERARLVIAIELMVAAQAVDLARVERLGRGTAAVHAAVRAVVPPLDEDRPLGADVERIERELLASGRLLDGVREVLAAETAGRRSEA